MSCKPTLSSSTAGETNQVYELSTDLCKKYFGGFRCARVGTIGDGSCFYHSVCFCMNLDDYVNLSTPKKKELVHKWRKQFAKTFTPTVYATLLKVFPDTTKTYEQYLDDFVSSTTWADQIQIKHVSNELNTNIMFIDMRNNNPYCGMHNNRVLYSPLNGGNNDINTILIAWVNHEHFEPIVQLKDVSTGHLRTVFKSPEDNSLIQPLVQNYMTKCKINRKELSLK